MSTIIPILFSSGAYYLSAQGYVYINPNEGSQLTTTDRPGRSNVVRCVYDEWYWEDDADYTISPDGRGRYTYTLGDMPKRNAQN